MTLSATSNQPKLSARARQALDLLADGGQVVHRLERNAYTGREQFHTRFLSAAGYVVKGLGLMTRDELERAGFSLQMTNSTSVSTYYKLNHAA